MEILDRKINDIVTENYIYASVLYYFGIQFYNYSEFTLEQVCKARGLDVRQVVRALESIDQEQPSDALLNSYPIDVIIHYLRHTHYNFINKKLPFVARLIEDLDYKLVGCPNLVEDLQILFPLFVEDFIHHIHEEEDTVFTYMLHLHRASLGQYPLNKLCYEMEKHSLTTFFLDHHTHDDEMRGIRELTQNYYLDRHATLHIQVLFEELKALEKDLQIHSKIEDNILFLKALKVENLVKEMIKQKTKWN